MTENKTRAIGAPVPCDGCEHLLCALEKSIVCNARDGSRIIPRDEAAACDRREGKEARP